MIPTKLDIPFTEILAAQNYGGLNCKSYLAQKC